MDRRDRARAVVFAMRKSENQKGIFRDWHKLLKSKADAANAAMRSNDHPEVPAPTFVSDLATNGAPSFTMQFGSWTLRFGFAAAYAADKNTCTGRVFVDVLGVSEGNSTRLGDFGFDENGIAQVEPPSDLNLPLQMTSPLTAWHVAEYYMFNALAACSYGKAAGS